MGNLCFFFFSSRRRHTRLVSDWSSDVCSSDLARLVERLHRTCFGGVGPGNQRRYSNQILAGIELALWDALGKALGEPVHRLMGGAVRDEIAYFGFVQGDGPDEVGDHARELAGQGFEVVYLKVGRGEALDVANTRA